MQPLTSTLARAAAAAGALRPAVAAARLQCTITTSCSPPAAWEQQQQLMRTAQHHQQQDTNTGSSSHARTIVLAGGVAAATASVGWAAWNLESSSSAAALQRQQQLRDAAASLARAPPRAQAAASAALLCPLLALMQCTSPSPAQLQGIAAALNAEQALGPLELADGLWGLALMQGSDASLAQQQHIASLAEAAVDRLARMPLYESIITVWAVTTLAGNLSSSSSSSSSSQQMAERAWQQLQERLATARPEFVTSESAMLHFLHAAMQRAAAAAAASGGVSAARQQQQQVQPRASLAEVLEQCGALPRRTQQRLAQMYQDYVPLHPSVEGPLLVLLHLASALPRYIAAAAAPAAQGAGAGGSSAVGQSSAGQQLQVLLPASPLVEIFGGLNPADAEAGAALMADPARLAKLKRELFIRWRSGELIDSHQRCVNELVRVLSHDMHLLPVQTPPDADVLLPSLRAAVLVQEGGERQAAGGATTLLALQNVSAAPPSPFTAAFWGQAHHCLAQLLRRRYAAPPAGFACRSSSGIAAAHARMLRQRGWTVVTLAQADVEAALGSGVTSKAGTRVKVGQEAYDHRQLEALLRASLSASL